LQIGMYQWHDQLHPPPQPTKTISHRSQACSRAFSASGEGVSGRCIISFLARVEGTRQPCCGGGAYRAAAARSGQCSALTLRSDRDGPSPCGRFRRTRVVARSASLDTSVVKLVMCRFSGTFTGFPYVPVFGHGQRSKRARFRARGSEFWRGTTMASAGRLFRRG
jgi:hypothetical protein